jgi:ABC-type glycerol-3-phosphate transport system permease component
LQSARQQFLSGGGFSWLSWKTLNSTIPVGQEVLSSTIVCSASIFIILCVGLPAGFAFSKLRFRASTAVFFVMVSAMMVPLQAILMPEFVNVTKLGLTGGYFGAILVYAALGTPFSIFLFTTYFRGVPDELIEAGIVDGLGYFGRPGASHHPRRHARDRDRHGLAVHPDLGRLAGRSALHPEHQRATDHGGTRGARRRTHHVDSRLMAGSLISALPAMIVYLIFQRYLVKGLTMGIDR